MMDGVQETILNGEKVSYTSSESLIQTECSCWWTEPIVNVIHTVNFKSFISYFRTDGSIISIKAIIFWNVLPYSLVEGTDVSG